MFDLCLWYTTLHLQAIASHVQTTNSLLSLPDLNWSFYNVRNKSFLTQMANSNQVRTEDNFSKFMLPLVIAFLCTTTTSTETHRSQSGKNAY